MGKYKLKHTNYIASGHEIRMLKDEKEIIIASALWSQFPDKDHEKILDEIFFKNGRPL